MATSLMRAAVGAMMNAIPVLILFFSFSRVFTDTGSYAGLAGQ